MLAPPRRERIVDVDQFFGELVKVEPALRVAVHFEPGSGDRFDRAVAEVEAGPLERGMRRFAEARLRQRLGQRRARFAAVLVLVEETRLLEAEAELDLAELLRLETRRGAKDV